MATFKDPPPDPIIEHMRGGDTRVRSLLITIYEDLILPRGGEVGIMALQHLFELLGLEAGAVRTAVSRLVADGWLIRRRDGRASFYRLGDTQIQTYADDARRVYAAVGRTTGNTWMLVHHHDADLVGSATRLKCAGFLSPSRDVFIWPLSRPIPRNVIPADAIVSRGVLLLSAQHRAALCPRGTRAAYLALLKDITQVERKLEDVTLGTSQAMALRLFLIHRWQGILLSHPELSTEIEPDDWPCEHVRARVAALYRQVLDKSEEWLRSHAPETTGPIWADLPARF